MIRNIKNMLKDSSAFTMVELLIAMALLVIIIFAFTPLIVGSIERIYYAGLKSEALLESQADLEVTIYERLAVDGYEVVFKFGENPDDPTVVVPGGMIEVEKSKGDARAWLSAFLPYVPSIKLLNPFLYEGYNGLLNPAYYEAVVMGSETKLELVSNVNIYTRQQYEGEFLSGPEYLFPLYAAPEHVIPDSPYDQFYKFDLPAMDAGLTNANSPYLVEASWSIEGVTVNVRTRLNILMPFAVAIGYGGAIIVSPEPDKEVWNVRNNAVSIGSNINDITYAFLKYFAVTSNGQILVWGNQEEPAVKSISGVTASLNGIVSGGDMLVAVGDAGTVVISTDGGNTWSISPSGTTERLVAVNWNENDNEFMAVGRNANQGGTVIRSTDPLEGWTVVDTILDPEGTSRKIEFRGLDYDYINERWVIVGISVPSFPADHNARGIIFREEEVLEGGTTVKKFVFIDRSTETNVWFNDIIYKNDDNPLFLVVGKKAGVDGLIMTSGDGGLPWSEDETLGTTATLNSVYYEGNWTFKFIVVGDNGTIITGEPGNWVVPGEISEAVGSFNLRGVAVGWED